MSFANLAIGVWAGIWTAVAAAIAYRSRNGDRRRAAAWMITIAAFLTVQEDPALLIWYASVPPGVDPDGVLGIVHPHTRGHMLGGGAFAAAGLMLAVWIAHTALRRGQRWAWHALLVYLAAGATVVTVEVLLIYPHGFPLGATPSDGARGFGYAQVVAWMLIWGSALWYCRDRTAPEPATTARP
jgi:hypothetical protein